LRNNVPMMLHDLCPSLVISEMPLSEVLFLTQMFSKALVVHQSMYNYYLLAMTDWASILWNSFYFYWFDYEPSSFIIHRLSSIIPNRDDMVATLLQQTSLKGLPPQWIRPSPPRLEIFEGEVSSNLRFFSRREFCASLY
jgi:hypothetical protein